MQLDSFELQHLNELIEQLKQSQVAHRSHLVYLSKKYKLADGDTINITTGEVVRKDEADPA